MRDHILPQRPKQIWKNYFANLHYIYTYLYTYIYGRTEDCYEMNKLKILKIATIFFRFYNIDFFSRYVTLKYINGIKMAQKFSARFAKLVLLSYLLLSLVFFCQTKQKSKKSWKDDWRSSTLKISVGKNGKLKKRIGSIRKTCFCWISWLSLVVFFQNKTKSKKSWKDAYVKNFRRKKWKISEKETGISGKSVLFIHP
jgi:hypothetical protein